MAGQIKVQGELSLDGSGWEATLRKAEGQVEHLAHESLVGLKGAIVGAFAIGSIETFVESALELGKTIEVTATRLGISTDNVQVFSFAARKAHLEINDVTTALERLSKQMETALGGGAAGQKALESFERLGVSLKDLDGATAEEIFGRMGEHLETVQTNARISADMIELMGRSGGKMIPLLKELKNTTAEMEAGGMLISETTVKTLDLASQETEKLTTKLKNLFAVLVGGGASIANGTLFEAALGQLTGTTDEEARGRGRIRAMQENLEAQRAQKKALKDIEDAANAATWDGQSGSRAEIEGRKSAAEKARRKKMTPEEREIEDFTLKYEKERVDMLQKAQDIELKLHRERETKEERITELLQKQTQLRELMDDLESHNRGTDPRYAQAKLSYAENEEELDKLEKPTAKTGRRAAGGDALIHVGNFLGTGQNTITAIGHKTNQLLGGIHSRLGDIHKSLKGHSTGVPST